MSFKNSEAGTGQQKKKSKRQTCQVDRNEMSLILATRSQKNVERVHHSLVEQAKFKIG